MFELIFLVAAIIIGVSYLAVVGFFLYYHNQLFNHMLYEKELDGNVFGGTIEELPDSIEIDDLIGEK